MYKVTLMDLNMVSCTSGTEEFFTDNIETFKREWFKLEKDEDRKHRFLSSLGGEIVTDYYSDDKELNIVQEDKKARILFRRKYYYFEKKAYNLENGYGWGSIILVDNSTFWVRGIRFKDKYYLVGKYRLVGVCSPTSFLDTRIHLRDVSVWGNRVIKTRYKSKVEYDRGVPLFDVTDFSNFKDDVIASICYIPMKSFKTKEELEYFVKEAPIEGLFGYLMRDIPGEAG